MSRLESSRGRHIPAAAMRQTLNDTPAPASRTGQDFPRIARSCRSVAARIDAMQRSSVSGNGCVMLSALLLLGLLPAAFLFESPKSDDEADDHADSGGPPDQGVGPGAACSAGWIDQAAGHDPGGPPHVASEEDDGAAAEDGAADGTASGTTLSVPEDADDTQISGFRPGIDRLDLGITSPGCDFHSGTDDETGDAELHIDDQSGSRVVTFAGLTEVPLGDISILVTDPLTGAVDSFALAPSGVSEPPLADSEGSVLTPSDPEAADIVTPADDGDGPAVAPGDPEAIDRPLGNADGDIVLAPVAGDDEEPANGGGGMVDGLPDTGSDGPHPEDGSGDDGLLPGSGGTANGGAGAELFQLFSATGAPALIDDFVSGQDVLRITLDPAQFTCLPDCEVTASTDGQDGLVRVDGITVAVLQGAPEATAEDIHIELPPGLAA
ncbi:hypothetical protein [Frigidibacter sp. ROC022]|uniref:hypothetical protein n=1 Tax=Frigidibacter sp. ROC022 TaxID=2971796 RepID=UPI00215B0399|nr:hypothetical protein [Frigidibacter sp. ROC022]MCR8725909.1 hypothetical protein [Frigidibacter sp. ROC022]